MPFLTSKKALGDQIDSLSSTFGYFDRFNVILCAIK